MLLAKDYQVAEDLAGARYSTRHSHLLQWRCQGLRFGGHTRKFLLSCISISILTAYLFYLLSLILLFLSAAANLSTASSRSSLLARSLSMARSAKLFSLSCPIVALRCVFSLFKHENERSHDAVETPSVNVICRTFSRSMKACLTGKR